MKILHVTIQTSKFEEELAFYQEHVGLTLQRDLRPQGKDLVFLAGGEGETCIEIIRDPEAGDAGNPHLSVGFLTEDVSKKREALIAAGFQATPMVQDPAGVRVQFM